MLLVNPASRLMLRQFLLPNINPSPRFRFLFLHIPLPKVTCTVVIFYIICYCSPFSCIMFLQAPARAEYMKGDDNMDMQPSYKEALVLSTASTIAIKNDKFDFSQNSLIVVTAAGTIYGTLISDAFTPDDIQKSLADDSVYQIFKNLDIKAKKVTNGLSASILLKDAVMINSSGVKNLFKYLFVFVDDIIAVSFGNTP